MSAQKLTAENHVTECRRLAAKNQWNESDRLRAVEIIATSVRNAIMCGLVAYGAEGVPNMESIRGIASGECDEETREFFKKDLAAFDKYHTGTMQ